MTSSKCDTKYVNEELNSTLDSSNAFEGPEKLLELWLSPLANLANGGLRSIPFSEFEELLDLINCKVLSKISSSKMDAYLLSESSMFVFNNKIIIKTCGTTTTLLCLEKLFDLVLKYLSWDLRKYQPFKLFYSRRSFMFPNKQNELHQNWDNEVQYLDRFFNNGDSYIVGKSNKDHWHLYTAGIGLINSNKDSVNQTLSSILKEGKILTEKSETSFKDQTFEVLMTELDQDKCAAFNYENYADIEFNGLKIGNGTFQTTKLNRLYESPAGKNNSVQHNCFSFNPCGFSSNSILNDDQYYTLHITPERGWSYASFETNVNPDDFGTNNLVVLQKILDIFKPGKFCFTIFELKDEYSKNENKNLDILRTCNIPGYERVEKILYDVDEYDLLYVNFVKAD